LSFAAIICYKPPQCLNHRFRNIYLVAAYPVKNKDTEMPISFVRSHGVISQTIILLPAR